MRFSSLSSALALVLLTGLAADPAPAQLAPFPRLRSVAQKERARPREEFNSEVKPDHGGAARGQPNLRGMAGLPPRWVENLREMPPAEQERFLQNNRVFQNLPPFRQAQIRKNLENWNKLSPTEREAIRDRAQILERMTPDQRQYLRNTLLPKWQEMPPERRQVINGRLHVLQMMGPAAQESALADPKFMQGLAPDEQSMLRDLNSFRNPPAQ